MPRREDFIIGVQETVVESQRGFQDICQLDMAPDQVMDVMAWMNQTVKCARTTSMECNGKSA